ncbi:MAG: T9SS type A sorting domain-containing protein [Paludibacter sp.]|nr:T9SS type A sorting domain-containing protein [Paludibacter sp.]
MKTKNSFFLRNKMSLVKTAICSFMLLGTMLVSAQGYPAADITDLTVLGHTTPWSVQTNLQVGNKLFEDRTYTVESVNSFFKGSTWIRTANDAKSYLGSNPLATFVAKSAIVVYIGHDQGLTAKPDWLTSTWDECPRGDNNDFNMISGGGLTTYWFYKKSFSAGSTVELGTDGGTKRSMYIIIVKTGTTGIEDVNSLEFVTISGKSIISTQTGSFKVYNLTGELLLSKLNVSRVDTNLSSGLYILQFTGVDGISSSKKIMIK